MVAAAADSAASAAAIRAAAEHPAAGSICRQSIWTNSKNWSTKLEHAFRTGWCRWCCTARPRPADHHAKFSDLNVLCVLKQITPRELGEGEPVLSWWREHGHPSPLLMSEEEVHNSADCFPIEFHDMKDHRKVLYGVDVIADLKVDTQELPRAGGA